MSKGNATRLAILNKAFELIYKNGYQATSIDEIIATTHVTKGAFFYHFKNKEDMGLALINEVMQPGMIPYMTHALQQSADFKTGVYEMMKNLLLKAPFFNVDYGCPAVNLIDEMSPVNELFKTALMNLVREWQSAIEAAFIKAQRAGQFQKKHDPKQVALYITANYGGVRNMGKVFGKDAYTMFLKQFKNYLDSLE
ncbi:TetR/AcrR family transcriptional regulator [Taibaiella soli]|uniref:TetR/AcrR family transcriptional regulator n=1 Tax=Taibaiella soli TaxID=1649169 RepID=A0A2W2A937_9BACT|nr:TetR/AcrR family transcriptional regulator [Taibaiella soli]PZF71781.1 TetR/AcrR family transcriptional regulator [Taibaiella soli]